MSDELRSRLLEDVARYDASQHTRSLLGPYREILLLQRAKFMSYEQIAGMMTRHGIKVSPAAVGCFCRKHFRKAEIEAKRRELQRATPPPGSASPNPRPDFTAATPPTPPPRRGPRIARDNY